MGTRSAAGAARHYNLRNFQPKASGKDTGSPGRWPAPGLHYAKCRFCNPADLPKRLHYTKCKLFL